MYRLHKRLYPVAAILLAAFSCPAQNYVISTFAGNGPALGDGGPAASARFGTISAIALASDGSLYIADSAYHRVRKVAPNGTVSTYAGGAVRGFGGDGGPATAAMLDTPTALALDSGGVLFIGDSGNHRVRAVSIFGNIQTVAGNGQVPPSPASAPAFPGEGGLATAAPLNNISGLGFASSGDLLISDSGNNRIFRVSGGKITTLAGNATTPASLADQPAASATLNGPTGLVSDYLGNIYFAEQKTGVVRRIDSKGQMTKMIGTGSPSDAPVASGQPLSYPLMQPVGLTTDSSANILIAEAGGRISLYMPPSFGTGAPASIRAVAGNLTSGAAPGNGDGGAALLAGMNPRGVAVDKNGRIFVADSTPALDFHNRVRVIASDTITTFAGGNPPTGKGDKGAAMAAELNFPRAVAIDPSGTIYIADTADSRVRAVTPDGNIVAFAGTGTAGTSGDQSSALAATLTAPTGLALDSTGNVYISDGTVVREVSAGTISTFAGGGASTQDGVTATSAALTQAGSLAVDGKNNVYVDQLARISRISSADQTLSTAAGNGTTGYSGDNGPATAAQIDDVAGVAVDSSGNLYIADKDSGRIRKVDSSGNISTLAGGGTSAADGVAATSAALNIPLGVAVDGAGNIYVAEYGGNRIRMIDTSGNIRTIAGNGLQGFAGDGGIATNASLNGPTDVKVDAQGNIYIADSLNSSIRKLVPTSAPITPLISKVSNAGSLATGPVAPGERVILSGTALGPNAKVSFGNTAAPVLSSSITSTMVVVPYELNGQTASQVTVTTGGVTSAPFAVQVAPSAPGILPATADPQGQALAFGDDGSPNSPDNPASAGSAVTVLCTGAGVLSPAVATGVPVPPTTPSPVLPVTATLGGMAVDIDQAYSIPGTIGEFAVDVRIPYDAQSASTVTLQIMVGNAASQYASIAIQGQAESVDPGSDPGTDPGSDPGSSAVFHPRVQPHHASRPLPPVR